MNNMDLMDIVGIITACATWVVVYLNYKHLKAVKNEFEANRQLSLSPRLWISLEDKPDREDGIIELNPNKNGVSKAIEATFFASIKNEGNTPAGFVRIISHNGEDLDAPSIFEILPGHTRVAKICIQASGEKDYNAEEIVLRYEDILGNVYRQNLTILLVWKNRKIEEIRIVNSFPRQIENRRSKYCA